MKKYNSLCFLILLFISPLLHSQSDLLIELQNEQSYEPVSYATVQFKGTNRGLIADYNGQFRIPVNQLKEIPVLLITSLGYKPLEIETNSLTTEDINIVRMTPQIEDLDAVVLNVSNKNGAKGEQLNKVIKESRKMLAAEIVSKAIGLIPRNLSDNPHAYIGYYRDYQIIEQEYYNLNEGILEEFDGGISTDKRIDKLNQSVLYSFKQNKEFNIEPELAKAYNNITKYVQNAQIKGFGGNEHTILNVHNPIRNYDKLSFSYVYQMNKDFLLYHDFDKGEIKFIDDEPILTVVFKNKRKSKLFIGASLQTEKKLSANHKIKGTISISLKDFAIHNFNYTVFDFNKLNPLFNINIEYRKLNNKMYLNYITFNNRFVVLEKETFKQISIYYDKTSKSFYVRFNSELDALSIKRKYFRVTYKGKKAHIKDVKTRGKKAVVVSIKNFDKTLDGLENKDMPDVNFEIGPIKDVLGNTYNDPDKIIAYQFREFFVQEVFESKTLSAPLVFINKTKALKKSKINPDTTTKNYIINSPLQNRKMVRQ